MQQFLLITLFLTIVGSVFSQKKNVSIDGSVNYGPFAYVGARIDLFEDSLQIATTEADSSGSYQFNVKLNKRKSHYIETSFDKKKCYSMHRERIFSITTLIFEQRITNFYQIKQSSFR